MIGSGNLNSEFFQNLKIQAVNSLLVNLNDMIVTSFFLYANKDVYRINGKEYYEKENYAKYHSNVYSTVWPVVYTLGSLIEIYIVYERIKILRRSDKNKRYWVS